jgi:hypothetical protein
MIGNAKRLAFALVAIHVFPASARAQDAPISIDNTCATCSRRMNDSLNVHHRRALRVNQVGFLPEQARKTAFAAVAGGGPYQVVGADGRVAFTGTLQNIGTYPRPRMIAQGYIDNVTPDYSFESALGTPEDLYLADFSGLKEPGRYRVVHGMDTSAAFLIHPAVYGKVLEKVLFFFGASRCGRTDSWFHGACHLKDGSHLGAAYAGRLAGGWHDCGDHGKYGETQAYAAMVLSLAYAIWPDRAPDRYGKSHAENSPDGIPDLLAEAKVGVDFIYSLYSVSKELGLLDSSDMLHSVGMGPGMDHTNWDLPERQDAAPQGSGGADRPVARKIGANVAGSYAASLAFLSAAWKSRDPSYSAKLEQAAIDIYDGIVAKRPGSPTSMPCCYAGGGPTPDDEAMAALSLWYATGNFRFGSDLMKKTAAKPFHHGGWTTDYGNIHAFVLYGFAKLILPDPITASKYGIAGGARDSLLADIRAGLKESISIGSNGDFTLFPGIKADQPYHGVFTSVDWGFNRYNLGVVNEILMYFDLTGDRAYGGVGLDNINYLLGANPYDLSFIMGCGDRNLQHPHYRAANPEGFNQKGDVYPYRVPVGAVMGGARPEDVLRDNWQYYVSTEACIDFAAQAVFPLLILSQGDGSSVSIGRGAPGAPYPGLHKARRKTRDLLGRKIVPNREDRPRPGP